LKSVRPYCYALIMNSRTLIFLIIFCSPVIFTTGQPAFIKKMFTVPYDSTYIKSYETDYTTRVFSSTRYNEMGYNDNMIGKSLAYRPNSKLLFGAGVNHGILGINIGVNFPFINEDDEKYGKTKFYDFTMRFFSRRYNTTIYFQDYRGYYLKNTKDMIPGWEEETGYYIRGDLRSFTMGLDVSYIFNYKRFSCRAAILQNELQKKRAGSFLVGGTVFYNVASGDSSIVPSNLYYGLFFNNLKFNRSTNFSIGPTFGYAYTFVIRKHFFILGSINGSINLAFTQLHLVDSEEDVKSGLAAGLRSDILLSAGYNGDRWYFGISYIDLALATQAPIDERTVSYNTGMFRINLVKRFATKKPIRLLNPSVW
jgi:hypothetical protein